MSSAQDDRLANITPGVTEEKFRRSHYFKLYNQTERCPSCAKVIKSLLRIEGIDDRSHPALVSLAEHPDSHDAIKIYSSYMDIGPYKFYKYINEQLMTDNKQELTKLMPFIRRATSQIHENSTKQNAILYRGVKLNEEQRQFFTIGKTFRFPGFTATTASRRVARGFGHTVLEIHVTAPCHQVIDMTKISYFREEEEWLFAPYSRFEVKDNTPELIILQAIGEPADSSTDSWDHTERDTVTYTDDDRQLPVNTKNHVEDNNSEDASNEYL